MIDPYFSATKMAWILDHVSSARDRAEAGELAAGTVDSFLIWHLTAGRRFVTDATNASRTLLMDIRSLDWADDLCDYSAFRREYCPKSARAPGNSAKPRASTSCRTASRSWASPATSRRRWSARAASAPARRNAPTAPVPSCWPIPEGRIVPSRRGLITTLAATLEHEPPQYALEGSVFVAGAAVQWFRDGLKAIGASPEINPLACESDPAMEVVFVPALTGLGAPYWEPAARGAIFGLTRATSVADLARATLEGVAFQVADLIDAMNADLGNPLTDIRVDGGMARSDPFLQFQADLLDLPIHRSPQTESTALGAALLAGMGAGFWPTGSRDRAAPIRRTNVSTRLATRPGESHAGRRWRRAVESVISIVPRTVTADATCPG